MKQDLKDKIREYSRMILYSNDLEAENFVQENPSLSQFVKRFNKRLRYTKLEKRVESRVLCTAKLMDLGVPKNQALISSKNFADSGDLEKIADRYHNLAGRGVSPPAVAAILSYEETAAMKMLDPYTVSSEYQILRSLYSEGIASSDLDFLEFVYLSQLRVLLKAEDRKEFVMGLKAARNSDDSEV